MKKNKALVPVVSIANRKTITTSLNVAEVFGKRHKDVLRAIKKIESSDNFSRLNFAPRDYVDERGKNQPMIEMTRDGFVFLVMGFTGKDAARFKEAYIAAFNKMERHIYQRFTPPQDAQWIEARSLGKVLRLQEASTIKRFVDYATAQGSKNAALYYVNISKMENSALFFLEQKFTKLRDVLDLHQLMVISVADSIVSKALEDGMAQDLNYRDIYTLAKERIETFAAVKGKTFIPAEQLRIASPQMALSI